ncbi:MAG: response regulator [Alphaproteobacteria bacterium]|jgi:signal transduction histidine kinase/DNA-binding response OmpR family regulator|nr:response regulator [Rhodospirillaceae bacterium]MBT6510332.1 response regulator [Rhodospirillaceae bacterium]MBT7613681.1 response regulator [Rhodospirillaceae bacterium]MBT7648154.1 response regulator [Rhodospirillaceae bacterium]MDG2482591.1 response regulator [Alphaproteobacteria bacterium]
MPRRTTTLRTRLLLVFFFSSLLLLVVGAGVFLVIQHVQVDKEREQTANRMIELAAQVVPLALKDGNADYLNNNMFPSYLSVFSNAVEIGAFVDGKVSHNSKHAVCGRTPDAAEPACRSLEGAVLDFDPAGYAEALSDRISAVHNGESFDAGTPVLANQFALVSKDIYLTNEAGVSELVGHLYVVTDSKGIGLTTGESLTLLLLLFGGIVVASLIAHGFIRRLVVVPLDQLVQATSHITQTEDYTTKIELSGTRPAAEMAELVHQFNQMVESVHKNTRALAQHGEQLEEDVRERTKEIALANDQLRNAVKRAEEASRAKTNFLAKMNHELRNPLNTIVLKARLVSHLAAAAGLDKVVEETEKIRTVCGHLTGVINQILDMSKIESGMMEPDLQTIAADGFMQEVATIVEAQVVNRNNTFVLDVAPEIGFMKTDPTFMRQVLVNLIGNSAKFTENGKITVSVDGVGRAYAEEMLESPEEGVEEWVCFKVTDTGIGMTPDELGHVFEPFRQANEGISAKYGGTGLGLSTSLSFCRLLGGDLRMDSVKDEGSTATIVLPRNALRGRTSMNEVADRTDIIGRRVLVIDDDKDIHDEVTAALKDSNVTITHAFTAQGGLIACRTNQPDVVLLDILMPVNEGWDVLNGMKGDPDLCDIPVIILSGFAGSGEAMDRGATAFLSKPLDENKLSSLMKMITESMTAGRPQSVLVVDDEEDVRTSLRDLLEAQGIAVALAADGLEALASIRENVPDLVVLDLNMPNLNGFETITAIRDNEAWSSLPIIVVTSQDLTADERKFLTARTSGYTRKGEFDPDLFIEHLGKVFSARAPKVDDGAGTETKGEVG